jgi:hypothetical protein
MNAETEPHCQRCFLPRSAHNPDAYNPKIKLDGQTPLHREKFIPVDSTLDVWVEDKKWVAERLVAYHERERKKQAGE